MYKFHYSKNVILFLLNERNSKKNAMTRFDCKKLYKILINVFHPTNIFSYFWEIIVSRFIISIIIILKYEEISLILNVFQILSLNIILKLTIHINELKKYKDEV